MSDYKKYTILLQTIADASGSVTARNEIGKLIGEMKRLEGATDAAVAKSTSLSAALNGSAWAAANATKAQESVDTVIAESAVVAEDAAGAMGNLRGAIGDVRDVQQATAALIRGDLLGAIRELIGLSGSSAKALGVLGGAAAALVAAWQVGRLLDGLVGISDKVADVTSRTDESIEKLRLMDSSTMANLKAELDGIQQIDMSVALENLDKIADALKRSQEHAKGLAEAEQEYAIAVVKRQEASGELTPEDASRRIAGITAKSETERIDAENQMLREQRENEISQRDVARQKAEELAARLSKAQADAATAASAAGVGMDEQSINAARGENAAGLEEELNRISWQPQSEKDRAEMAASARASRAERATQIDAAGAALIEVERLKSELAEARSVEANAENKGAGRIGDINQQIEQNLLRRRTVAEQEQTARLQADRQQRERETKERADYDAGRQKEIEDAAAKSGAGQAWDNQKLARFTVRKQKVDSEGRRAVDAAGNPVYSERRFAAPAGDYGVGHTTPSGEEVVGREVEPDDAYVKRKARELASKEAEEARTATGAGAGAQQHEARVASAMATDLQQASPAMLASIVAALKAVEGNMEQILGAFDDSRRNQEHFRIRLAAIEGREKGGMQ